MIAFALGERDLLPWGEPWENELLPLSPTYALEYLVIILIVVAVGGLGSLKGTFIAAILIGIVDTAGKYFLPEIAWLLHLSRHAGCSVGAPIGVVRQTYGANRTCRTSGAPGMGTI